MTASQIDGAWLESRWGEADGDDFENRSGANLGFVSTGSAEIEARCPPQ